MRCLISLIILSGLVSGNYPSFEPSHRMRILLLPADMRVGSVIYRLRATDPDYDYPLRFDVVDSVGRSIIKIESLPCTPTHTFCQANVHLTKRLEPDRVYDMLLSVRDSTGQETKVDATIKATRATSHFEDVFPYVPNLLMVPEDAPLGSTLAFVLARKGRRNTELEMWGSENFRLYQTAGTRDLVNASIKLTAELDFEQRTMYMLTVYALEPWTVEREDSRNIAGFQIPIVVTDIQDMPPVFTQLPPVTTLHPSLKVGDKVLQVQAQDGDRGSSRQVRYGLVSEKNPFTIFFNISERTGELILAKPLSELQMISRTHQPIVLTVMAEEVKMDIHEPPALTATATVALLLETSLANSAPRFMNKEYVTRLKENAPQGTALVFGASYSTVVEDLDTGQEGVFALNLLKDNGTFEISPTVGESRTNFVIRVRNNILLDYEERTVVSFTIIATELTGGASGLNSSCEVVVYLEDENDNVPVFQHARYETVLPENVTAETLVVKVTATDLDSGLFGRVFYTGIMGYLNHSLTIESLTGVIQVASNNHGFDREAAAEYKFQVEARDMEGIGNKATVPLIIKLRDINDNTPEFEHQVFEFILQPGLRNFTSRAYVKAVDKDAEPPNNVVRYEIISGNVDSKFHLNEVTGELTIRGRLGRRRDGRTLDWERKKGEIAQRRRSKRSSLGSRLQTKKADDAVQFVPTNKSQSSQKQLDYEDPDEFSEQRSDDVIDSVIVLNVRAYDLGIPHRWQRATVRVYPPESRARNMNFIVAGSNPDLRATEDLLRTLTGGRVIIQEVKPYTGREQGTDLTSKDSRQEKSVVTATVIYDGNSVVDLQQLEARLSANKTQAIVEQSVQGYRIENRVLFWLLIFLLICVIIAAVLLLLCCLWQGCIVCPCLEVHRKARVISPSENLQFILKERSHGVETKGVQAVVYPSHKEAWSAHGEHRNGRYYGRIEKDTDRERDYLGHRRGSGDSIGYTPAAATVGRHRHPTMLVEDVEGRENDLRNHQRYKETGGRQQTSFNPDVSYIRRSPDTPRFPRGVDAYGGQRNEPHYMDRSPGRGENIYSRSPGREETFHSRTPRRQRSPNERESINVPLEDRSPRLKNITDLGNELEESYHHHAKKREGEDHTTAHKSSPSHGVEDRDDLSIYRDEILYRQADGPSRTPVQKFHSGDGRVDGEGNLGDEAEGVSGEMLHPDSDSLRRHEVERGSVAREWENGEEEAADRDQLYIRDGNAEILRLITRGPREDRPHTLVQESGKEILMQRFMEDQGDGNVAGLLRDYLTQDYLGRLLYQETQSLPGHVENATQTDCDAATQTDEPANLLPAQRNARSDNELSDDDAPVSKNRNWKKGRRANIKTPIMEEGESLVSAGSGQVDTRPAMFALPESTANSASIPASYTENKSSILRRRKAKEKEDEESEEDESFIVPVARPSRTRSRGRQPATVQIRADSLNRLYRALKDLQRTGSLNELTPSEDEPDKNFLNKAGFYKRIKEMSTTTTGSSNSNKEGDENKPTQGQQRSKYMDWYKNLTTSRQQIQRPANRRKEDDLDSGIALSSLLGTKKSKIGKKSVFTIAYDDVQTKNIRPDTNSSQQL